MKVIDLRDFVLKRKIKQTAHVAQRIQERDISKHDITHCIVTGEIIEQCGEKYFSDETMETRAIQLEIT